MPITSWNNPTPGTLPGAWATPLNAILDQVEAALQALELAFGKIASDDATAIAARLAGIAAARRLVLKPDPDQGALRLVGANDAGIVNVLLVEDYLGAPMLWVKNAGGLGANDWIYTQKNLFREPNNLFDIYGNRRQNGIVEFAWPGPPGNMLSYVNACQEVFDTTRAGDEGDWVVAFGSAAASYAETNAPIPSENAIEFTANTTSMQCVTGTGFFGYPVTAGGTYSAVAYLKAVATARSPQVGIQWFDSGGGFISESLGSAVATNTSTWTKVTSGSLTAPGGATYVAMTVKYPTTVNLEKHRLSGAAMYPFSSASWSPPAAAQPWPTFGQALAGDRWWRTDTPSSSGQRLYVCTTGGLPHQQVWQAVAALSDTNALALGAAAAGTSTEAARRDHVHPTTGLLLTSNLSSATPAAVATTGASGSSADASRADHAHQGQRTVQIKVIDDATTLTTGDGKVTFCIPSDFNGLNLIDADAYVTTNSSSGTPTIQLRNVTDAVDMLSTRITIDASEPTSYTAAAAPVVDTAHDDVATGDLVAVDVDVAGTGAKGLGVILRFG